MNKATDEELKTISEFGRLGFSIKKIADFLQCEQDELTADFRNKKGEIYHAYNQGRLQGLVDVRNTIMQAALNSSTPAIERMLAFFAESEKDNLEIWEI